MGVITGGVVAEGLSPQAFGGAGVPSAGTDEIITLTVDGDDGTYVLSFLGASTTALAHDANAATVQAALRALRTVDGAYVSVAANGGDLVATFGGNLGKLDLGAGALTADVSALIKNLVVGDGTVTIVRTTPGVTATGRGSPAGSRYTDETNGVDYVNTGTALDPVWTEVGVGAVMPELTDLAGKIPEAANADVAGLGIAIAAANPTAIAAADPAALAVAIPAAAPAGGVGAAAGGWDTAEHRDAAITTINGLRDDVVEIEARVADYRTLVLDLKGRQAENLTELTELKLDIGTLSTTVVEIKTQLNALLAKLRDAGIITP